LNRLLWMQSAYGLSAVDRVLQKTPYSFDVSVWEFFWPLLVGARLVIARPEGHRDNRYLVDLIADHQITTLHFVPSMLQLFVEEGGYLQSGSLQRVMASGEALPLELARSFKQAFGCELHNLYGPTEAAVDVTAFTCGREMLDWTVPIGRPIANLEIVVLGWDGSLAPLEVAGELHIGGVGLGRGYLGRADLTAERFVPHPFGHFGGERLYRTGDLARLRGDGEIEFLGRIDHQVKIRGFRIELGEIEAVLTRHPAVREAVVVATEVAGGEGGLIGFVVADVAGGCSTGSREYEEHLAQVRRLFDDAYAKVPSQKDRDFNLAGWISACTGLPFSQSEMLEWVNGIVARILVFDPKNVLEIGCGTGLLLFRIAPQCLRYTATDLSPHALRWIEDNLPWSAGSSYSVELLERAADDFAGLEELGFDVVVLNSVVQYFPDFQYLVTVLERAVAATRPGGVVVIGDVRNLALLAAFHFEMALFLGGGDASASTLRCAERLARAEHELVIDPEFFHSFAERLPQVR